MAKYKIVIEVCILRCILGAILYTALYSTPAHAVWDYSLAAQIAMHDGIFATCEKIEPRMNVLLSNEWSRHVRLHGIKAIRSARKSTEYSEIYQDILFTHLTSTWGDSEKQAHACEEIYINLLNKEKEPHRWWQDRFCVDLPIDSEKETGNGQRCGVGPGVQVSFENTIPNAEISILRLIPSSDISFPRAGMFFHWREPGNRIVSYNDSDQLWALPESVDFEWKEWPRTIPSEIKDKRDFESARLYVDDVRGKVQRKRAQIVVRGRIPPEVIAGVLQAEQTAKQGQAVARRLKLFFSFMPEGVRFRWEEWNGGCIRRYGGDEIDLPRNQLLSGDWICGEPEPESCHCRASPLPAPAPSIQPALVVTDPRLLNEKASSLL